MTRNIANEGGEHLRFYSKDPYGAEEPGPLETVTKET